MSATITVRKAVPADFDTLFQLYIDNGGGKIGGKRELLWNGLRKLLSSPDLGFHIVAEAEGETVGMYELRLSGVLTETARFGGSRTST